MGALVIQYGFVWQHRWRTKKTVLMTKDASIALKKPAAASQSQHRYYFASRQMLERKAPGVAR